MAEDQPPPQRKMPTVVIDPLEALSVAKRVLPPLAEEIEGSHDVDRIFEALAAAFQEGTRYGVTEFAAQLIEGGAQVPLTFRDGDEGPGEPR